MGQKNQLWWDLPAIESLHLNKRIYELDDNIYRKNLEGLSDLLEVKDLLNVQVRRLSLGERMKMELIAALVHNPRVLLLDEPTIGLDIISQKNIRDFLKLYNEKSKTTIILTSHYMKDIEDMCKRAIVINQGELVYDGKLNEINGEFNQKKIVKIQFLKPINQNDIQRLGNIKESSPISATIEVEKKDLKTISSMIFNEFDVVDFNIEDIPLEDSIALLYKKG
ncbi:AAA family ATPase [Clostridium saccharoperbutylacetonicum]|uniref:AAA family ATPase n=1 Tax=Clostridium saccharoperbutylacetonicum TaxID=36745 RepID=UPI0039E97A79